MGCVCDIMCTCVYDYSTTQANQSFALVASRNNAIVNDAKNRETALPLLNFKIRKLFF